MSNPIEEAIAALRHGDQATAFTLLRNRLAQEPKDAGAWLWLSEATPDVRRKMEALTRFLALAPNHPHAPSVRLRLQQLQVQFGTMPTDNSQRELLLYEEGSLPPPAETTPAPRPFSPPATTSEGKLSLRERITTAPQPVVQPHPENNIVEDETVTPTLPTPTFTPRPAAPPPPNFKPMGSQVEEDDGLPIWVWALMILAAFTLALFLYFIFNFERFSYLFQ